MMIKYWLLSVIRNDFEEKGWTAYRIWKEHLSKGWTLSSVQRIVKGFKTTGTMEIKAASGRPVTATTEENGDLVEELVCSQEEPGTNKSPWEVAPMIGISRSSGKRLVRSRGLRQFKRLKTPRMRPPAYEEPLNQGNWLTDLKEIRG